MYTCHHQPRWRLCRTLAIFGRNGNELRTGTLFRHISSRAQPGTLAHLRLLPSISKGPRTRSRNTTLPSTRWAAPRISIRSGTPSSAWRRTGCGSGCANTMRRTVRTTPSGSTFHPASMRRDFSTGYAAPQPESRDSGGERRQRTELTGSVAEAALAPAPISPSTSLLRGARCSPSPSCWYSVPAQSHCGRRRSASWTLPERLPPSRSGAKAGSDEVRILAGHAGQRLHRPLGPHLAKGPLFSGGHVFETGTIRSSAPASRGFTRAAAKALSATIFHCRPAFTNCGCYFAETLYGENNVGRRRRIQPRLQCLDQRTGGAARVRRHQRGGAEHGGRPRVQGHLSRRPTASCT